MTPTNDSWSILTADAEMKYTRRTANVHIA